MANLIFVCKVGLDLILWVRLYRLLFMLIINFILIKNFKKWEEFGLNTHKDNLVNQDEYIVGGRHNTFQI